MDTVGSIIQKIIAAASARDWILVCAGMATALAWIVRTEQAWLGKRFPALATFGRGVIFAVVPVILLSLASGLDGHIGWRKIVEQVLAATLAAVSLLYQPQPKVTL
jgi:hypothetical protein